MFPIDYASFEYTNKLTTVILNTIYILNRTMNEFVFDITILYILN